MAHDKEKNRAAVKAWKKLNPEKVKEQVKRWREKHRDYVRLQSRKFKNKYKKDKNSLTYWGRKHWRLRNRAKKKGLVYELTTKDVKRLREDICIYCGSKNEFMTIDRKDNKIGYILDNCVTACYMCNKVKSWDMPFDEMKIIGEAVKRIKINNPSVWNFDPNRANYG